MMLISKLVVLVVTSFVLVGCGKMSSPTAPSSEVTRTAEPSITRTIPSDPAFAGRVEVRSFNLEGVRPHEYFAGASWVKFTYSVSASQCVVFISRDGDQVGGDFIDTKKNVDEMMFSSRPGSYLLELRCVDRPDAQEGEIRKINFQVR